MKSEIDLIDNVLRKIVIPRYDAIIDVKVGYYEQANFFHVTIFVDPDISNSEAGKIVKDTETLYKMITGKPSVMVNFTKSKKNERP